MSRIGKKIIAIPSGVELKITNQTVTVKGKMGSLTRDFHNDIEILQKENGVQVEARHPEQRTNRALWGLSRTLLNNMVIGVSQGFTQLLEIQGVGYRAAVEGRVLQLNLGFSHPVNYELPDGVNAKVEKNTQIAITGMNPETIGQACADIRSFRPPEPYKGKGVRLVGEYVVRKEGKKK